MVEAIISFLLLIFMGFVAAAAWSYDRLCRSRPKYRGILERLLHVD